jgi:hypothetical protein
VYLFFGYLFVNWAFLLRFRLCSFGGRFAVIPAYAMSLSFHKSNATVCSFRTLILYLEPLVVFRLTDNLLIQPVHCHGLDLLLIFSTPLLSSPLSSCCCLTLILLAVASPCCFVNCFPFFHSILPFRVFQLPSS